MTIGITCNLSDGVILGADSAITVSGKVQTQDGLNEGILKVYNDAEKVFQILGLPIGVVTYGVAMMQSRTLKSYIREFEFFYKEKKLEKTKIADLAKLLYQFFTEKYEDTFKEELENNFGKKYAEIPEDKKPFLGLVVCGFSHDDYLPEVWQIAIPRSDTKEALKCIRQKGQFGSNWYGQIDSISRIVKGYDPQLINHLVNHVLNKFKIQADEALNHEISGILKKFEHKIAYDAMPLQEGIDHVKFLLDVVINETKYVLGAPTCGGNITLAVIDRTKGFVWVTDTDYKIRVL